MEKYTIFDDLQNGRNPFRPIRGKKRKFAQRCLLLPLRLFFVPLRLIFGISIFFLLKILSSIPLGGIGRLLDVCLLRLLLLCLGFWNVTGRLANTRKLADIGSRRRYVTMDDIVQCT